MIIVKGNVVEFKGSISELAAEITGVLKGFHDMAANHVNEKFADELIDKCVEISRMDTKTLEEESDKARAKNIERMNNINDFLDFLSNSIHEAMKATKGEI